MYYIHVKIGLVPTITRSVQNIFSRLFYRKLILQMYHLKVLKNTLNISLNIVGDKDYKKIRLALRIIKTTLFMAQLALYTKRNLITKVIEAI